jgi:hypothetical protein
MTTEGVDPILIILSNLVLVAGSLCLIQHLFLRKKDYSESEQNKLKPWNLKLLDHGIVLTFVYLFSFIATALAIESYKLIKQVEEFPKESGFILVFPMSIAMLLGLYGFYRYYDIKAWSLEFVRERALFSTGGCPTHDCQFSRMVIYTKCV